MFYYEQINGKYLAIVLKTENDVNKNTEQN
jgi:hypothetical protein